MKIISFVNQKGGVAKTTSALALADYLSRQGERTLVVDFDAQGSLTTACGLADDTDNPQALKLLGLERGATVTPQKKGSNLDVITSDMGLERANVLLLSATVGRERYLARALKKLSSDYDYCVIDSNPSLSIMTINVLYASDYVIVPFKPEFNSFAGIKQLISNIAAVQEIQPNVKLLGFAVTMAVSNRSSTVECIEYIKNFAAEEGYQVFTPAIRLAVAAADAPSYGQSLYEYDRNSNVAKDYELLCQHIYEAIKGDKQ
jgi:chromosome partitioning protein